MQTQWGLTNCTGNSRETSFSFSCWRIVKSWGSHKFFIVHCYFHCCLSCRGCHQAFKEIKLWENGPISFRPAQARNEGCKGGTIPGAPSHHGGAKSLRGGGEKSKQCHKHFLQSSTFASERPQFRTWGRQTCFLPRSQSNLVTSLAQRQVENCVKRKRLRLWLHNVRLGSSHAAKK